MLLLPRFRANSLSFFANSSKPTSKFLPLRSLLSPVRVFSQRVVLTEKNRNGEGDEVAKVTELKQKIEAVGIDCDFPPPGKYTHVMCPKCNGGRSLERSLSFHINQNEDLAIWRCFRLECGWAGQVFADTRMVHNGVDLTKKGSSSRKVSKCLWLEPLCEELIAYFAERMISKEILQRNDVMQLSTDQNVIAFTYKRNGVLVNCKYRSISDKRFWQDKGAEKILYGVDDIKEADEIIIVEGEIDKLSMEQAGLTNSVSVPDGAPQKFSTRELPPLDKDTRFQYLWNCKEYLDKASRIILATDGDGPGQVLAEELARRLGRERCWLVQWPKKDEECCFKDANEVLRNLGAGALRDIIDNAKLYQGLNLKADQLK